MNRDLIGTSYNSKEVNYGKIVSAVLSRWYWIAICIFITVTMAWGYLSLIHSRYSANASIMLNDKKSDISQILSPESEGASNTYESYNLTQSAVFIIRSDAFLSKAVSRLNYRYSFYTKERWSYEELYPIAPFTIDIIKQDTTNFYSGLFSIINIDNQRFKLSDTEIPDKTYNYGDIIKAPGITFRITNSSAEANAIYYFRIHTKESLVVRAGLTLSVDPQNSNILSLTHTDVNPNFAADILNAISQEFVVYESYSRRFSATQRLKFIDEQLDTISNQVNISATDLENFKKRNNLDNLQPKVQADISRIAQLESNKQQFDMERLAINQLERQIKANDSKALLNFNLEGAISSLLSTLVSQLNDQIRERENRLLTYNEGSGPIVEMDKKIAESKDAIARNIIQARLNNEIRRSYMQEQISALKANLESLPSDAKDYINLQTEYTIKQKIYSTLIEERLRSSIALSAIEPGASIIYSAVPSYAPIWPIAKRIYMMAVLAGGFAGLLLIFLVRYLNRRIRDIGTVQEISPVPVIGLIRKLKKSVVTSDSQTLLLEHEPVFIESIRSLRNSLVFLMNKSQDKVICISSEVSGEGRSFTAAHLGYSLAQLEKKVIIIDADLRKPSNEKSLSKEKVGLSAYLSEYKSLMEVIQTTEIKNLDILPAGITPSNPSELLQNYKMEELLGFLQNIYDYIIIDTSPLGAVSDAVSLISKADINLFILRSGKTGLNALSRLEKVISDYNTDNFFLVLNEFKYNPLYESFYSSTDMSLYFNKGLVDYTKKFNADNDQSRWRRFRQSSN